MSLGAVFIILREYLQIVIVYLVQLVLLLYRYYSSIVSIL